MLASGDCVAMVRKYVTQGDEALHGCGAGNHLVIVPSAAILSEVIYLSRGISKNGQPYMTYGYRSRIRWS